MSEDGQSIWARGPGTMTVATRPMAPGVRFEWHTHEDHQIAWALNGVLTVTTADASWILPPTRALWIPAGLEHETSPSTPAATLRSVYLRPQTCPVDWTVPTPIAARPLLAEIIAYLEGERLAAEQRARAEAVLLDLLEPAPIRTIELRIPTEGGPARRVAAALAGDPADRKTLEQWGREVGASGRTLARAFQAETGMTFGRWRALARLRAAIPLLAEGLPVTRVAAHVGYESASAFVAAFRRETGLTPAAYFRPTEPG